ncbi:MAG: protein-disulfide reductase DsbD domain-containing protein, partial [Armatimonadota bacterium]
TLETFGGMMVRIPHGTLTLLSVLDEWKSTRKEKAVLAERPIERIEVEPTKLRVRPNETKALKLKIAIAKGWHINSAEPQPNLQPTQVSVESELVTVEGVKFPPAKEVRLPFSDEPIKVYEGETAVVLLLRGKPHAHGEGVATLRLRYQACDDKRCLMPAEVKMQVTVKVEP